MEEITRRRELWGDGPSGGDPFGDDGAAGNITVSSGPYLETIPAANMTVQAIRERFGDRLDLDPQSIAVVDGTEAGPDTVVKNGMTVMFCKRAGEKG